MINLIRDPRWGRADEAPTEDPLLAGAFGAGVTKGVQRRDAERLLEEALARSRVRLDLRSRPLSGRFSSTLLWSQPTRRIPRGSHDHQLRGDLHPHEEGDPLGN